MEYWLIRVNTIYNNQPWQAGKTVASWDSRIHQHSSGKIIEVKGWFFMPRIGAKLSSDPPLVEKCWWKTTFETPLKLITAIFPAFVLHFPYETDHSPPMTHSPPALHQPPGRHWSCWAPGKPPSLLNIAGIWWEYQWYWLDWLLKDHAGCWLQPLWKIWTSSQPVRDFFDSPKNAPNHRPSSDVISMSIYVPWQSMSPPHLPYLNII